MKNDIRKYRIHSKLLFGNNLKIFLQSKGKEYKVLELKDIIGFMDNFSKKGKLSVLRIDKPCGSYGTDLSIRLQRPEIEEYPEVFIFEDKKELDILFRGVAKSIEFRDFSQQDSWF